MMIKWWSNNNLQYQVYDGQAEGGLWVSTGGWGDGQHGKYLRTLQTGSLLLLFLKASK